MPDKEENLNTEENSGFSVHDVSQRLSIPENTLRKYLAYFDLEVERIGRKNYLSEEVVQCLSEILQLKSNSWSLKQIKAFREAQKNKLTQTEKENKNSEKAAEEEIPENNLLPEQKPEPEQEAINLPEQEIIKVEIPEIEKEVKKEIELKREVKLKEDIELKKEIEPRREIQVKKEIEKNPEEEEILIEQTDSSDENLENENAEEYAEIEGNEDDDAERIKNKRIITILNKPPLTKDYVNKEIATQAKRASRLYRFLGSRNSAKDSAEIKADLNRRVEFLNGLRYIRDNWLERQASQQHHHKEKDLSGVN